MSIEFVITYMRPEIFQSNTSTTQVSSDDSAIGTGSNLDCREQPAASVLELFMAPLVVKCGCRAAPMNYAVLGDVCGPS